MKCTEISTIKSGQFIEIAYLLKLFFLGVIKTKEDNYNKNKAQYLGYITNFETDAMRYKEIFTDLHSSLLIY